MQETGRGDSRSGFWALSILIPEEGAAEAPWLSNQVKIRACSGFLKKLIKRMLRMNLKQVYQGKKIQQR